jgi:hypothetical protein
MTGFKFPRAPIAPPVPTCVPATRYSRAVGNQREHCWVGRAYGREVVYTTRDATLMLNVVPVLTPSLRGVQLVNADPADPFVYARSVGAR